MTDTRGRILAMTAELFRRYGYTGTGMKQIVEHANAPYGSIYHFFPGGKEELGREAILRSGRMYGELVAAVMDEADDLVGGIELIFEGAAATLEATDYADACPIATVALEVASTNEPLRQATAEVFEEWIATATDRIEQAGLQRAAARDLAMTILSLLEGAFVFSRALRTTEPVLTARQTAASATRAALKRVRLDENAAS